MVESRTVATGARYGAWRVIASGLQPADRVVVTGLARASPGSKVAPSQAKLPPPPQSAG
jgi:multidrug efflux pump subunit AcrA (membrane-fusion protein)